MSKTASRRDLGRHSISAQLLSIIDNRGLTPYAVAKLAGISPGIVSRFVSGERDIRLGTMDQIAAALGLRLVEVGRSTKGRAREARPIQDWSLAGRISCKRPPPDLGVLSRVDRVGLPRGTPRRRL